MTGIIIGIVASLITIAGFVWWVMGRAGAWFRSRRIDFYEDRSTLNRSRHSLEAELKTVESAWAAWYTGTNATSENVFGATRRITRLILLDPDGAWVQRFAPLFKGRPDELQSDIRMATRQALKAGADVRWYDGPLTNMLLGDPDSPKGWVRVEVLLSQTADRPGFLVHASGRPGLFLKLKTCYQAMWDDAKPAAPE